ncbi:ribosome-binding factor A [Clostridia bacterium]|nr:ribosome-binding factor A [Clostridia bacterium]
MPNSNRLAKINGEILRELGSLLPRLKDPRLNAGLLSITRVDVTKDMRFAKIYVSALGNDAPKELLKGLKSSAGFLRRELAAALTLRQTPELLFELDDSIQHGAHILDLLRKTGENNADTNADG